MRTRLIILLLSFMTAALALSGLAAAQGFASQSSSADGVTIKATPRSSPNGGLEFEIVFDTHSQELKDDLMKTASLTTDGRRLAPNGWQADPPGGHHRKGVLRFDATARAQVLELTIARPGESKPRLFRWQAK
ncbi:MAG: hypothetical protein ACT4P8_20365 [Betaproteobacteria bacterium]